MVVSTAVNCLFSSLPFRQTAASMKLLAAFAFLALTTIHAAEMKLVVKGATLNITADGKPLLTYQMQAGPVPEGVDAQFMHGAHLHPIWSPAGKIVTGNHPPDHYWHRGVWMAWTHTEFEGRTPDFWNMGKDKTGRLSGEVRFVKLIKQWTTPDRAGFISEHQMIDHTSGSEKPVLNETWEVTASALSGEKPVYLIDLVSTQTCVSTAVKLPKYHYGGLGVRGNTAWDPKEAVTMLTSEGADRMAGDGKKASWVHIGGDVDGAPTGLAVLIHPSNFRFPQPLRLNPKNPQLCVAPSADGDWSIEPSKPYISRYRLVVVDGKADAALLERVWQEYAKVEVK